MATVYIGIPKKILIDRGSSLRAKFMHHAKISYVDVKRIGIGVQSCLFIGERSHEPLLSTFLKLLASNPNVDESVVLACTDKAMNDNLGPEGLATSALVFIKFA